MKLEDLHQTIDALYATFERYPLRPCVEGCPCCVSEDDQARLHARPLRELSVAELERYMWKALTTWGNQEDFKHFLPRMLEIMALEHYRDDPEVMIGKLAYTHWRRWPRSEQAAVESYFLELWNALLDAFPSALANFYDVDTLLGPISQVVDDITSFLALWQKHASISALRHLASFAIDTCQRWYTPTSWYQPALMQVNNWLFAAETIEALEQAFFRYMDEPFANEFAEAHRLLLLQKPS